LSEALAYGMVDVNMGFIAAEHGITDYVEMKYLCIGDTLSF